MSPNDTEYIDPSQLYMDSFIYLDILQVQIFVQHGPRTNATLRVALRSHVVFIRYFACSSLSS